MEIGNSARHALAATALVCSTGQVQAAGTRAGSVLESPATVSYTLGSQSYQAISVSPSPVIVDEILGVTVASLDGGSIPVNELGGIVSFKIENTGNGGEAFALNVTRPRASNAAAAAQPEIAYDSNGNGFYDHNIDQLLGPDLVTSEIAADDTLVVFVIDRESADADGRFSGLVLTATAATGGGHPGTIYPGPGERYVVVGANAAAGAADSGILIARTGSVTLTKSVAISDLFGGTTPVSGGTATYTLRAAVVSADPVKSLQIKDRIPEGTRYRPDSLRLDGIPLSDGADADAGEASAAGITVEFGDVAAGISHLISFSVAIN